ncbi:MAG: SAM-dependent methyltransferase [Burkholderiales bacterium 35-55-47]|jgi:23S rRNA (cytosine1962-C5)-methyltransferase|uniref:class I SAM-dependent methyltransferase n=1 Tax=Limnohabitans sp. TaxID=1907725 RepID=UPI000BD91499|nr:class I SAM-dependent methyltransferase [Limnohabitans sp.]OYY17635.1 MAG: SAM-dependent methyltransferase [Burkholderiales bacterium 35-55-47]OYZ72016.1 MAG: SAM-dependent methyltransferase [Burkholderiales bacterium 24-55-52]OZA99027.1 MAG: SAM-dependent methyltransferase [Burkholderiales bacterium 39-55-53]HQR86909.1 class I SAM-dependent methyltransferase [Limnohabitans sp.]HQS26993.1 class I SAM-dependent methyltransferase [Limnohabitans sp.]
MQALLNAIAAMDLSTDAHRVFHGRGGLHPGCEQWALDAFPPVMLLTSFQPVSDDELAAVRAALSERWAQIAPDQPLNWVFQCRAEGHIETRLMSGAVPDPHVVTENGSRFRVHVLKGQNHGLFLDMAEGREWVRTFVRNYGADQPRLKVLNLFAYTCAFSVVALQAGAKQVVNVDMSHGAMAIGQQNHPINGITTGATFLMHDIFKTWGKITRSGPYGLVIVDPPSYQKGSFIATKDYAKLMRRLPELLAPGGYALLCLNAPELGLDFLQDQMKELAPELRFVERVANPAAFADVSPERSLKVLAYQMPSLPDSVGSAA